MAPRPNFLLPTALLLTACSSPAEVNRGSGDLQVVLRTEGLDLDTDGFQVTIGGAVYTTAGPSGMVTVEDLAAGPYQVGVTGLASNCSLEGSAVVTVQVTDAGVATAAFNVLCTATSGVIRALLDVAVDPGGAPGAFKLGLDGGEPAAIDPSRPVYLAGVSGGDHAVTLLPPVECSSEVNPKVVNISIGGLVRDTVKTSFAVNCTFARATLHVTAPTTGPIASEPYQVLLYQEASPWDYGAWIVDSGAVQPNGSLMLIADPGYYYVQLVGTPHGCTVDGDNPTGILALSPRASHELVFPVHCGS